MSLLGICPTLHCLLSLHFLVRLLTRSITFGNENGRLPAKVRKERRRERKRGRAKNATSLSYEPGAHFPRQFRRIGIDRPSCGFNSMFTTRLMALPGRPMYTSASMAMAVALE